MALIQDQPDKMQLELTAVSRQERNAPSRFLDLPAELRNRIYRYAMVSDEAIEVQTEPIGARRRRLAMVPALTKVSKQLRSETQRLFVQENRFKIKFEIMETHYLEALQAFRRMHRNVGLKLK